MDERKAIAAWLNEKFLTWVTQEGERKKIKDLAIYLEVKENLLSRWLSGDIVPSNANVIRIANKFGPEIYDLLEWPRPLEQRHQ